MRTIAYAAPAEDAQPSPEAVHSPLSDDQVPEQQLDSSRAGHPPLKREPRETPETAAAQTAGSSGATEAAAAADWQVVLGALRTYGETDRRGAERLLATYRAQGEVTPNEIVGVIHEKALRLDSRKQQNPMGWLLEVVAAAAETFFENRAKEAQRAGQEASRRAVQADLLEQQNAYDQFCEDQIQAEIARRYPPEQPKRLQDALQEHLQALRKEQPDWFGRVPEVTRNEMARTRLRAAVRESLGLPEFARWRIGCAARRDGKTTRTELDVARV